MWGPFKAHQRHARYRTTRATNKALDGLFGCGCLVVLLVGVVVGVGSLVVLMANKGTSPTPASKATKR